MSKADEDQKDYVAQMAGAALGGRLRRLSASIDADLAQFYSARGIRFEQRWYGLINQLALKGPMSVGELAATLGLTHASISEARKSLEDERLVVSQPDPADARRRTLSLSRSGHALVEKLTPLWKAFDEAARALDAEAGGVTDRLAQLEKALARQSLSMRIGNLIDPDAGIA